MPRPKRSKIVPSIPAARGSKSITEAAKKVIEDVADERDIVTGARRVRKPNEKDIVVAAGDPRRVAKCTITMNSEHVMALEGLQKRRDAAMGRLEAEDFNSSPQQLVSPSQQMSSSPAVEVGRREIATPAAENSILAIGNFQRKSHQPSIPGQGMSRARSSSVESNLTESNGPTNLPSMENSILVRGNFRRRQRKPSILGRAGSRVRSSSIGLEMDRSTPGNADSAVRAGIFKRRARQPSILGTAKKNQQSRTEYDYDDEDDFNPDDESTPLNLSKTRSTVEQESQPASSTRNSRKRKLSPREEPRISPPLAAESGEDAGTDFLITSRAPSDQAARPTTPEPLSDTMAPPRSSSPSQDNPEVLRPSRRTNLQIIARSTRRQPDRKPLLPPRNDSLPSSPPSLTHSPNGPTITLKQNSKINTRPKPEPASLSTTELQALLPRRRRRPARGAFDLESSDDGEVDVSSLASDEDELTRSTRPLPPRRVARLKPGPKVKAKAAPAAESSKSATKKAYASRRVVSDKENVPDEDGDLNNEDEVDEDDSLAPIADPPSSENSQELEARVGKELKTAKRKFEVIDKWELEFEDMTAGSSSPWDAR